MSHSMKNTQLRINIYDRLLKEPNQTFWIKVIYRPLVKVRIEFRILIEKSGIDGTWPAVNYRLVDPVDINNSYPRKRRNHCRVPSTIDLCPGNGSCPQGCTVRYKKTISLSLSLYWKRERLVAGKWRTLPHHKLLIINHRRIPVTRVSGIERGTHACAQRMQKAWSCGKEG